MLFVKRSYFIFSLIAAMPTLAEELAFDPSLFHGDVDIQKHMLSGVALNTFFANSRIGYPAIKI